MTTHMLYAQIQEPESQGGKFHEKGETGDFTNVFPDLADLIRDGHVGIIPDPVQPATPTANWSEQQAVSADDYNEVNNA